MDAISLLMALMLTLSEHCTALPDEGMKVNGEEYRMTRLACGDAQIRAWQRWCSAGRGFWTRPFLLEEMGSGRGVYMNEFAELQTGWHVQLNDVYYPACGA